MSIYGELARPEGEVEYTDFLKAKYQSSKGCGFDVEPGDVHPMLKPHQRDIVRWAVHRGRAAIFAAFGLGKSLMQLEIARLVSQKSGGRFLIICPLGVRQEFKRDAEMIGIRTCFIRRFEECAQSDLFDDPRPVVFLTNYETVRDGKLDPNAFDGCSLDEASILRGFGGTKTFREFMRHFENNGKYKFVATATPSPNDYIELLAYAAFLDVMDVGQGKTRFFKRDSTKADCLTLHPHKVREFYLWLSTFAIFVQKPSDLGHSDEGYDLPAMDIHWHEIPSDHSDAGWESYGQGKLLKNSAICLPDAAREKRDSLDARVSKMLELRHSDPDAHLIVWHDLEDERRAIEKALPNSTSVYGAQDMDEREQAIMDFSNGKLPELSTKPSLAGSGCNFQRYCAWAIYLGIGFKFNDFAQSLHRLHRYLQTKTVRVDLIYTEAEREIRRVLEDKWDKHKELTAQMSHIIREYGLGSSAIENELKRSLGLARVEVKGDNYTLVNNDSVLETMAMPDSCVDLILTSIPFSMQYEYSPSYNDFGHTESNEHFWQQMDFLSPELLRILSPGRIAAVHVKDRIVPGGMTGLGFQTAYPFHCDAIHHYEKHGFAYLGMKTVVTDVVRENNQTYRLGWTEQCKDGSRMGVGMPEYLLLLRKPPSDSSNGYADVPVGKEKSKYSRSRWQIDAHGFERSSGNRLLVSDELRAMKHSDIFKAFREHSLTNVYDLEEHVRISESLELCGFCNHIHLGAKDDDDGKVCGQVVDGKPCDCHLYKSLLPTTFMLLQPQSWHPDVWTDITRMLTLNGAQSAKGKENHLCPMQFDLADRVITQMSMEGETVFDPFSGLGTVAYRALKLNRKGYGVELAPHYFADSIGYCQAAEMECDVPTLFDMQECSDEAPIERSVMETA
ncbi:MAG TPA: DNA methyltransferase [Terracidiphilus sp.]|jgi:DNA modification methylase